MPNAKYAATVKGKDGQVYKCMDSEAREELDAINAASASDVDKALSPKTVVDGKVTEWQFVDATDRTAIIDAVEDWMDEHITNPDSPPLDRSLSIPSAAAPADIVGELKNETTKMPEVKETIEDTADLYLADTSGNVLAKFANGHIQTKEFDSSNIPNPESIIDDMAGSGDENKVWSADKTSEELDLKIDEPETEGASGQVLTTDGNGGRSWTSVPHETSTVSVKATDSTEGDLDLVDSSGNVLVRFEDGHIKTKNFDSRSKARIKTRMGFGAHNGAEYYAPECTVPAYRIAGQQGWEWAWIAGIAFSSEGSMYVIHDDTVDRTTDGTGYINQMTDAQINALNITQTGSGYDLSDFDPAELKIPTLEQVVQQCVRYGMKMVIRLSLFPNGKNTPENTAKWEAFEDIIHGYGIQPEDMSCYLDSGTKAITCRTLFGDDVEISTHLGINATAQDFVDWYESRSITGRKAAILSYQNTSLAAVKLLHEHGIRCYSYGSNLQANADNCASWGVDIYQNGKIHEISY